MKITTTFLRDVLNQYDKEEISISRFAELLNEQYLQDIKRANELLRSVHSIAERKGADTNWEGLQTQVDTILKEQHLILYGR
jgi:hypothetical protein